MTSNKAVGLALRDFRRQANKTLQESAQKCGHTKSWLSDIEQALYPKKPFI